MRFRASAGRILLLLALLVPSLPESIVLAQTQTSGLRGQVTDPSGAAVSQATVTATPSAGGTAKTATTNRQGIYEFTGMAPGSYTLTATANGFAISVKENVEVSGGPQQKADFSLEIEEQKQQLVVSDQAAKVDVSPSDNASAIVIKGKDLEAFSDDPDELQSELTALAGPSAGPNGGQFYVDGFTAGQLPPKDSIREIRVNQNPFSAEYDKLGYGRIEIFTKPGTDQFHGQLTADGNTLGFDTRNPFLAEEPGFLAALFSGNVSGPIKKNASFFFNFQERDVNQTNAVNAVVLDSNFNQVPLSQGVSNPTLRTVLNPRVDYQLTPNNTLTVRYQYWRQGETNEGIGQFALPSQGYNVEDIEHTLQVSDTQVISSRTVNETRFQFLHEDNNQTPLALQPQISVLGAFTGGGSNEGTIRDSENHYEIQNYTSMSLGRQFLKFGGRLRVLTENYNANANFNGTFTFSSLNAYQITEKGLAQGLTLPQIIAEGGGASQFTQTTGTPLVNINLVDAGLYIQDDWRVRPNLTLSYGLRFETQNDINNHADWAPRVGLAWGIGRGKNPSPKTVLRTGFGLFYDRFTNNLVLQAEQLNGVNQSEFIVRQPSFFPTVPAPGSLVGGQVASTVYRIDPTLRAPYTIQTAASLERQVSKIATVSVTYLNSRGVHQFLTNNINAPLPGTFNPAIPSSGIRPFGNVGNIYEYESVGIFKQNELITNFNVRAGTRLTLFGFYSLNYADSDTSGPSSFPANPYSIAEDYGRAAYAIRDRIFVGGSLALPYQFRLSPLIAWQTGTPFNITIGQDLNGSSIFNQRPAFANASTPAQDVIATSYGTFNLAPSAGESLIPINFGTGPSSFTLNLRVSKTFAFGPRIGEHAAGPGNRSGGGGRGGPGGGGPPGGGPSGGGLDGRGLTGAGGRGGSGGSKVNRRFSLTLELSGRNVFNNVNLGPPVGNLSSPIFGRSNELAGGVFQSNGVNRRIDLHAIFSF